MVDVSIVIPCLNEALSLGHCLANARDALDRIAQEWKLSGEIVVADNGSQEIIGRNEIAFLKDVKAAQVVKPPPLAKRAANDAAAA